MGALVAERCLSIKGRAAVATLPFPNRPYFTFSPTSARALSSCLSTKGLGSRFSATTFSFSIGASPPGLGTSFGLAFSSAFGLSALGLSALGFSARPLLRLERKSRSRRARNQSWYSSRLILTSRPGLGETPHSSVSLAFLNRWMFLPDGRQ